MKSKFIIIIGIVFLYGCNESSKQANSNSISTRKVNFYYTSDSKRLILRIENVKLLDNGQEYLSFNIENEYIYDSRGLLIKEISRTDGKDDSTLTLYFYDSNDSLILDMTINELGDTTAWHEYSFFPDGKQPILAWNIIPSSIPHQEYSEILNINNKETILAHYDYDYDDKILRRRREFDENGEYVGRVYYDYNDGRIVKESMVLRLDSNEKLEISKYYDYSKSFKYPDFYSVNSFNDTLEYYMNEFKDGRKIKTVYIENNHLNTETTVFYSFDNGRKTRSIEINKDLNLRFTESFTYNDNGDIKETILIVEEINAH